MISNTSYWFYPPLPDLLLDDDLLLLEDLVLELDDDLVGADRVVVLLELLRLGVLL